MSSLSGPESHSPTPIHQPNFAENSAKLPSQPSDKTGFFQKAHGWEHYNRVTSSETLNAEWGNKVSNALQNHRPGSLGDLARKATLAGCCTGILAFSDPLETVPFFIHKNK